jgi:hypothetical protein
MTRKKAQPKRTDWRILVFLLISLLVVVSMILPSFLIGR